MLLAILDFVFLWLLPGVLIGLGAFDFGKQSGREEAADEFLSQRSEIREDGYAAGFDAGYDAGYREGSEDGLECGYGNGYWDARTRCLAALTGDSNDEDDE